MLAMIHALDLGSHDFVQSELAPARPRPTPTHAARTGGD